jgi:hypothetical protein
MLGTDDLIGTCNETISVFEFMKNTAQDRWFNLEPKGKLHLIVDVAFPNSGVRKENK